MIEIYEELVSVLERGEDAVLATLISRHGSAPGALGAKMIVRQDGSTLGTIGGGCVEAEVWQAGKDALERGEATILSFRLTPADAAESGLICGGSIDILVEPIQARCLSLYRSVVETLQAGGRGALGTVLPVNADEHQGLGDKAGPPISLEGWTGNKFFAPESGEVIGGLLPAAISELTGPSLLVGANTIHTVNAHVAGAPRCVLIEPLLRRATVFLFGAGHLSRELAPLASRVGFRVVVIDDREVFANSEAFPDADQIIVADFGQASDRLSIDESSYLVILTRGHAHDELVLEQALRTKPGYVGMIGSRTKIATIYRELRAKGFTQEQLDAVHAPIGLPIGARSPEEIAVSILAEVISVRNHGRATSSVRNGAPHDEGRGSASQRSPEGRH